MNGNVADVKEEHAVPRDLLAQQIKHRSIPTAAAFLTVINAVVNATFLAHL
jgi:hypothetical protein